MGVNPNPGLSKASNRASVPRVEPEHRRSAINERGRYHYILREAPLLHNTATFESKPRTHPMTRFTRRQFVVGAAAGAAALSFPIRRVLGANETVNMAFIGVGGRGTHSAKWFGEIPGVRVAAVCDVDKGHIGAAQKSLDAQGIKDVKGH